METDYLVVGAGASGMAFADALINGSDDAEVVMIDRRRRPGGHWHDAYPFVQLHQPSAFYGVNSHRLGDDRIDQAGPNAGFYERASAAEISHYFDRALEEEFLPSGRVGFFGLSDYLGESYGDHRVRSRLTGEVTTVRVRRKIVDATYLEGSIPATHTPSFGSDGEVAVVPPNDLDRLGEPVSGYTVIGAGKTGMDTCSWLMDNGVAPDHIRWIRPRDSWLIDRGSLQPLELVAAVFEWIADGLEAAAGAEDVMDLFRRLEEFEHLVRLDPHVEPTMYRGAILSEAERDSLRQIEQVVRMGRVTRLGSQRIHLEDGDIPTIAGHLHIDCTAAGLADSPPRPIFEPNRITVQTVRTGMTPFNAALIGFLESSPRDDREKNRLCPVNPYPRAARDWIRTTYVSTSAEAKWTQEPDLVEWLDHSRLNVSGGVRHRRDEPSIRDAVSRILTHRQQALTNLQHMLSPVSMTSP